MICPKCQFDQPEDRAECLRCGIVFEKYRAAQSRAAAEPTAGAALVAEAPPSAEGEGWVRGLLLAVEPSVNPLYFAGRMIAYAILLSWGWQFIVTPMETNYVGESFMHLINTPFHEAGHLLFSPFGRFLQVLGGSLGQILMPLICAGAFLFKNRDAFGASVALWWTAQNFMDVAPYINDARALELILLGGVTGKDVEDYHDWEQILGWMGWLEYDHTIAHASYNLGIVLMLLAFSWGGYVLYLQWKRLESW